MFDDVQYPIDQAMCDLEFKGNSVAPAAYAVRVKARTEALHYFAGRELYPLKFDGEAVSTNARAYLLLPQIFTGGEETERRETFRRLLGASTEAFQEGFPEGLRHHEVARMRAIYYVEDRALGIWEIDVTETIDETALASLWRGFEEWMLGRHPEALHVYTDDDAPSDSGGDTHQFLQSLGYQHAAGRVFVKNMLP